MEVGCCRDRGTYGEGLLGIWDAADGGAFIQVLGTHSVIHQHRLDIGGSEYATRSGKVGGNGKYLGGRKTG